MEYGIKYTSSIHFLIGDSSGWSSACGTPVNAYGYKYKPEGSLTFNRYQGLCIDGCRRCRKSKALSSFQYNASLQVRRFLCWILPSRNDEAFPFGDWLPFVQGGFKPLPVKVKVSELSIKENLFTCSDCGGQFVGPRKQIENRTLCTGCYKKIAEPIKAAVRSVTRKDTELERAALKAIGEIDDILTYGPKLVPERIESLCDTRNRLYKALKLV